MAYQKVTAATATNTADFFTKLSTFVVTTCGWTLLEDGSAAGTPYMVWSSVGETGNEKIYIKLTNGALTNSLSLNTYRYWAAGAPGTGQNPSPASDNTASIMTSDSASFLYWLYGDLDRIAIVTKIGATYYMSSFGILTSAWSRSFATTANSETAGSGVVIEVDSTAMFTVNKYYLIGNTNDATGIFERVQVTAIDPGVSITATIANNHPAGAIIGEDPRPNYVQRYGAIAGISMIGPTGVVASPGSLMAYSDWAPATYSAPDNRQGLYWLYPYLVYLSATDAYEYRGSLKEIYALAAGALSSEDTVTVGSTIYKFFGSASTLNTYGRVAIKQE
jgi:hypothetical protein